MTILAKAICRFNVPDINAIKLAMAFFTELEQKKSYNLYGDIKDPEQPKQSGERLPKVAKAIRAGGIRLPDFRFYYKVAVSQNIMVLAQKQMYRSMEQDKKPRDEPTHL